MRSRLVRAVPAGLLALTLLAACGDETGDSNQAGRRAPGGKASPLTSRLLGGDPLDDVEATAALLAAGNLPDFLPETSTEDEPVESDGKSGCETQDSFDDRFDRARIATTRVDAAYLYGDQSRLLIATSLVASYATDDLAVTAYDEVQTDFTSCSHYEVTEGTDSTVVDIENDTDTVNADVDDQLNLLGQGTWSSEGFADLPLGFGLSLARVDNSITMTQVISLGVADDRLLLEPYTEIAVERLQAVLEGETPEDVVGPTPVPQPTSRIPFAPKQFALDKYLDLAPIFGLPD